MSRDSEIFVGEIEQNDWFPKTRPTQARAIRIYEFYALAMVRNGGKKKLAQKITAKRYGYSVQTICLYVRFAEAVMRAIKKNE